MSTMQLRNNIKKLKGMNSIQSLLKQGARLQTRSLNATEKRHEQTETHMMPIDNAEMRK